MVRWSSMELMPQGEDGEELESAEPKIEDAVRILSSGQLCLFFMKSCYIVFFCNMFLFKNDSIV